jgi:hypothetical protein
MSELIKGRLEEVMSMLPCPIAGCWFVHGANTAYYYDDDCECHVMEVWPKGLEEPVTDDKNRHKGDEPYICFEFAEFEFTELVKQVPMEYFHFSQERAIFEIGWKEFGQDLVELRVHLEPEEVDEG